MTSRPPTDPQRQRRIEDLFDTIRQLPPGERAGALRQACDDDEELHRDVESLLRADDAARGWRPPTGSEMASWSDGADAWLGKSIGGCKVVRRIAHGGMGVVYEATQESPQRTVALKLMRSTISTEEERIRFEHEASILGGLRHPGVAQVYQAGTHRDRSGVTMPYIVMELVRDARAITSFVADESCATEAIVKLVAQVCDAVQHAHQRGVIHRDLKPSNILVDAEGHAKVIDFGVAKTAADQDAVTLTRTGQVLGTLAYASPEQVLGRHDEVDTRSDVYALGMVLYELLVGSLPYDLKGLDVVQVAQRVDQARIPAADAIPPDLLLIVRCALARTPGERYESMAAFADDLRRFGRGAPVSARTPSWSYHLRLFAQRNRALVVLSSIAAVALIALTIVSVRAAADARAASRRAQSEQRRTARMLNAAQRAMSDIAGEFFDELEPVPGSLRARRIIAASLERGLNELKIEAGDEPGLRHLAARTATHLSRMYGAQFSESLGATKRALSLQRNALQELEALAKTDARDDVARDLILAHIQMADFLASSGQVAEAKHHSEQAEAWFQRVLKTAAGDRELHARWASFLLGRAWREHTIRSDGRLALLKRALKTAHAIADDKTPQRPMLLGEVHGNLGQSYIARTEVDKAQTHLDASRDAFNLAKTRFESEAPLLTRFGLLYMRYGDLARTRRQQAVSLSHYEKAATYLRRRLTLEPNNSGTSSTLGLVVVRLSRAHRGTAARYWGLPFTEEETEVEPGAARKKRAWLHLSAALSLAREGLRLSETGVRRSPDTLKRHHARCESRLVLADSMTRVANYEESKRSIDQALVELDELDKRSPNDQTTKRLRARATRVRGSRHSSMAYYYGARQDQARAIAELERGIALFREAQELYEPIEPQTAQAIAKTIQKNEALLTRARGG